MTDFILRQWRQEDAPALARCANSSSVAKNLRDVFPHPYTPGDARAYIDACIKEADTGGLTRAIVVEGRPAGSVTLLRAGDVYRMSAELGYWLAEEHWGRGIMSRAVAALCREGFARWDILRISAQPFAGNTGSRRVLEKNGFTLEGVVRQGVCKNGVVQDYCIYGLLRSELHRLLP